MSGISSAGSPGPESPPPQMAGRLRQILYGPSPVSPERTARRSAAPKQWTLKMMWAPLLLTAAAVALGLTAWKLYPRITPHVAPSYASLYVTTSAPITDVLYNVTQTSSAISKVKVEVDSIATPPAHKRAVNVGIILPGGTLFQDCPHPACTLMSRRVTGWTKSLTFKYVQGTGWTTTAYFLVKADRFGVTFNGLNAATSIPDITYQGPGKPSFMLVKYLIPSANSYDWSTVPIEEGNSYAVWEEPLTRGEMAAQASTGVNHVAQEANDTKTFIAGALIGLAGAALVAAIIEAVHMRDWDVIQALRSK